MSEDNFKNTIPVNYLITGLKILGQKLILLENKIEELTKTVEQNKSDIEEIKSHNYLENPIEKLVFSTKDNKQEQYTLCLNDNGTELLISNNNPSYETNEAKVIINSNSQKMHIKNNDCTVGLEKINWKYSMYNRTCNFFLKDDDNNYMLTVGGNKDNGTITATSFLIPSSGTITFPSQ